MSDPNAPQDRPEETTMDATDHDPRTSPDPGGPPAADARHPVRVSTIVWGLVVAVVGAGLLAASLGLVFDVELAAIAVLGLAGAGLLAGTLVNGARRNRG